jgi:hypothetical protein
MRPLEQTQVYITKSEQIRSKNLKIVPSKLSIIQTFIKKTMTAFRVIDVYFQTHIQLNSDLEARFYIQCCYSLLLNKTNRHIYW